MQAAAGEERIKTPAHREPQLVLADLVAVELDHQII
jgi:hypothetical protein